MKLPKLSPLTHRISVPQAQAWEVTNRAHDLDAAGEDIIHLGIGDPDMDTDDAVRKAVTTSLERGRTHYPPLAGENRLREKIASHSFEFKLQPEQIVVFPGAQTALFASFQCIAEAGDEVILLQPTYATYPAVIETTGATIVYACLEAGNGFQLDVKLIESLITDKTCAILLNSPSNPSGTVFSRADISTLVSLCRSHSIWLVSDEVYASLVFDGEFTSPLHIPGSEEIAVVLRSLSKSHAMSGWRLGWSISSPRFAHALTELSQPMLFGVSQFIQDAALTALERTQQIVPQIREIFLSRRNYLCARLEQIPGLVVHRPSGGMFALVDISQFGCDGNVFANRLLDTVGVSVVPGFAFGETTVNYIRIGFSQDMERLKEAMDRIARFAEEALQDRAI